MSDLVKEISDAQKKAKVVDVRSGDTVRVYQKIKEGNKTRIQMFEGVVIRTDRKDSLNSRITVRKITSGVGVEKSYLLHSPLVEKVEVVKRGKVRRNYLTYLRDVARALVSPVKTLTRVSTMFMTPPLETEELSN